MMWSSNLDSLALLAKDRHAELLAQAEQQLSNRMLPARPYGSTVWQWLHRAAMDQLRHVHLFGPTATRHSVQHR